QDASRMMAVVGATTKAAAHGELQPYVDRFHQIAAARLVPAGKPAARSVANRAPIADRERPAPPRPPGRVIFFLRLSPTRALMLTEGMKEPALLPGPAAMEVVAAPEPVRSKEADPAGR